ncbi:hypothetical protein BDB01DRAFT_845868 [Pilobolus umbonatus]|nr:hypothetical protein BDB01DRAFT_845868 [Pilobolus umbonatus]
MPGLIDLPNEIVSQIMANIEDRKDVSSLLRTCQKMYSYKYDNSFWKEVVTTRYNIYYCDPAISWWTYYISGEVENVCPHINLHKIDLNLKRKVMWDTFQKEETICCEELRTGYKQSGNHGICLDTNCTFVGCGDAFFQPEVKPGHLGSHHKETGHNLVLKLSPLNFMEVWCYACNNPIGYWGFPSMAKPRSEKFVCDVLRKFMTEIPSIKDETFKMGVIQKRRWIEKQVSVVRRNHDFSHMIEKTWYTSWTNFLAGQSQEIPTALDNSSLFLEDLKTLRTDLVASVDYELVSAAIRSYIERVYGLTSFLASPPTEA